MNPRKTEWKRSVVDAIGGQVGGEEALRPLGLRDLKRTMLRWQGEELGMSSVTFPFIDLYQDIKPATCGARLWATGPSARARPRGAPTKPPRGNPWTAWSSPPGKR
jgi:hypothetical protein